MPSFPCKWPTCQSYVARRGAYCPDHAGQAPRERAERHRFYDQHKRDRVAKAFYNSAAWLRARAIKLATTPFCERCIVRLATTVHHRRKLRDCDDGQKMDQANFMSLCAPCHNAIEAEATKRESESCSSR